MSNPTPSGELVNFEAHPNLLWDVITKQAGTLGKALLEGVTNSCDGGAAQIEITVGPDSFSIQDNGRGFADKAEIDRVFKVFGQPHVEGDATFGRFRMGRGQLMAFASTEWRSNGSVMTVDIKRDGLRYAWAPLDPPEPGCRIVGKLYEPLSFSQMNAVVEEVTRNCKYIAPTLLVNGKQANEDPSKKNWSSSGAEFWAHVTSGGYRGIDIYQQGVYVETIPAHEFGLSGVVITKPGCELRLNFARNQVIRSCPRFKKIMASLGAVSKKSLASRRGPLDDSEIAALAETVRSTDCWCFPKEFRGAAFMQDVTGRRWSYAQLQKLAKSDEYERQPCNLVGYTFRPEGDLKGDKLMQAHRVFVFSEDTAVALRADAKTGFDRKPWFKRLGLRFVPWDQIKDTPTGNHRLLRDGELTERESLMLRAVKDASESLGRNVLKANYGTAERALRLGESDASDGWTDGKTFIAVSRAFLARCDVSHSGLTRLGLLLVHEYCHEDDDSDTHVHSPAFYRRFHDSAEYAIYFSQLALNDYLKLAGKLPIQAQRQLDKQAFAQKLVAALDPAKGPDVSVAALVTKP